MTIFGIDLALFMLIGGALSGAAFGYGLCLIVRR